MFTLYITIDAGNEIVGRREFDACEACIRYSFKRLLEDQDVSTRLKWVESFYGRTSYSVKVKVKE